MTWLSDAERPFFQDETAMQSFRRRMSWRRDDVSRAQRDIAAARAFNRGHKRLGVVPVYATDASEENIQQAVRRLNFASWGTHHTEGDS